jgi:hypothetical protein
MKKSLFLLLTNITFAVIIIISVLFFTDLIAQQQKTNDVLYAGTAVVDITPDLPVQMGGYASRKELSDGIYDRMIARVITFENSGKRLVFVSCDIWDFRGDAIFKYFQQPIMKEFNLNENELFLCATHSHSTPTLGVDKETSHPNNLKYTESLRGKLIKTIRESFNNMSPVSIGVGIGYSPIGVNRRETAPSGTIRLGRSPYGAVDKEVLVMKLVNPDGSNVASLINFGCHATVFGANNLKISSDVLGSAEKFVEKIIGKGIIAPLFTGASGDINPWLNVPRKFNTEPGRIPETELLGTMLGTEVVNIFRNINTLSSGGKINSVFKIVDVPGKVQGDPVYKETNLKETVNVTAARIGDIAFIGYNVEMLTEIGMAVKNFSPFKYTFIITHCNGYNNYLPPKHLFKEGGYEIMRSSFSPDAADIVVKESLKILYGL